MNDSILEILLVCIKKKITSRKSWERLTGSESGVMALAITPPGVFGDLRFSARLQTEV